MLWDEDGHAEVDLRTEIVLLSRVALLRGSGAFLRALLGRLRCLLRLVACFQLLNLIVEHLLVKLHADFTNMTRLFIAHQIPKAANVHIVTCQVKTSAQAVQRLHHFQALWPA